MNVTEVTTIAGCVAGLGVIALIASGWRQPARVERRSPRWTSTSLRRVLRSALRLPEPAPADPSGAATGGLDPSAVVATPWWHRIRSVVAGTGLALWMGAVMATVLGFAAAFIVISLTSMLRR